MTWVAAADYRRAHSGRPRPQPCQVYGKVEHLDHDLMIGAIASGAAEADLSYIGCKVAARAALSHLKENAPAVRRAVTARSDEPAQALYRAAFGTVLERLRAAAFDHVASVRELATTLTLFAVDPSGIAAMQVGDGMIVSRGLDSDYRLIFGGRAEHTAQHSVFVTSDAASDAMRVGVHQGPVHFLCAASDALGALSIRSRDGVPQQQFFRSMDRYTRAAPDDNEVHRGIRSFLRSDRVNSRLDVDLGIALCGYRPQGELFSAAAE